MLSIRANAIGAIIIASILITTVAIAYYLNTDFGNVDIQVVSIASEHGQVSGLMYKPRHAIPGTPKPAVVLAHGISSSRQFLSGIALELARNSIVALTIDLIGHGASDGQLADGGEDATLGTLACVRYLESQPFVNSSLIGIVGHSLGAGAVRATTVAHGNITATVFIGGGFGSMVAGFAYGTLTATFPKNLLVAVGEYDVLFDLPSLKTEVLPSVFGISAEVEAGVLYGDFSVQTARKLVTPATTHLFEPIDPIIASETVEWLLDALKPNGLSGEQQEAANLVCLYRDAAILVGLIALISLTLSISTIALDFLRGTSKKHKMQPKVQAGRLEDWKLLFIYGGSSLALFFPMVFVGLGINIPPVLFGASLAWWMLATALVGLLLLLLSRFPKSKLNVRMALVQAFEARGIAVAIAMFVLMCLLAILTEASLGIGLGIIAPFFRALQPSTRIPIFFMFVPFFLVHFTVEGLVLLEFRKSVSHESGFRNGVLDLARVLGLKVGPYLAVLFVQYVPLVFFGFQLFPSFAGFLIEFLWLLAPIFAIAAACSWWFYRNTSRIGAGAVFNALMFAWIAAGLFPF